MVGTVQASGLTPETLSEKIQEAATKYLTEANVTVSVRQINSRRVYVTGQVNAPGVFPLGGPLTVMQLLALAGGLSEFADKDSITIMRVENGETSTIRFNYDWVMKGRNLRQNILLQPGDLVVVP